MSGEHLRLVIIIGSTRRGRFGPTVVSFHDAGNQVDADGRPTDPDGCGAAAKTMLDQIEWWALALQEARTKRPYKV